MNMKLQSKNYEYEIMNMKLQSKNYEYEITL